MEDKKAQELINEIVHEQYWKYDTNCARVTLLCLSKLMDVSVEEQTYAAAIGMHGAGGFRAQCGLVEGALMFIGLYLHGKGKSVEEIVAACYSYGEAFEKRFGSLRCRELRQGGFREDDPPHLCEGLTRETIAFAWEYLKDYGTR